MLAGARRLAAAAVQGGASRCSVVSRPPPTKVARRAAPPYHLRASSSATGGHVDAPAADPTSPPPYTARKPLSSYFTKHALRRRFHGPASSSAAAGQANTPAANATSQPAEPTAKPLSELFTRRTLRGRQSASIAGSAATALYSTSADGAGSGKQPSRQEGPPLASAPRQRLSSLFAGNSGRGSAAPPSRSATAASPQVPAREQLPTASPQPLTATTDQQSATGSLAFLFSGKPLPPPFSPPSPVSHLPFLNEAPPSSEPLEPLPRSSSDQAIFSSEELYDPVQFVKKYPLVVQVHPLFAQDTTRDKWTFTEIGKELGRSLPKTTTEANERGISYEKFTLKDLVIAANLSNPDDIGARFLIKAPTKTATPDSMEEDLKNSGLALKELMELSVGTADFWDAMNEDITNFLEQLEKPLEKSKRYLTVNHACLFPLEVMSQAYIICFEFLFRGRVPHSTLEQICAKLPDGNEKWKSIALENPLFEKALKDFRVYAGSSQTLQAEWRRNTVSHKTKPGDDYPPTAVDIMLQFYFPMFMVVLLRTLFDGNMLLPLKLHRLFRR